MKKSLLFLFFLLTGSSFAQIIITGADAANFYKPGRTWNNYSSDTLSGVTMDVGSASSTSQTWSFPSSIQFSDTTVYTNIEPSTSPFASTFPTATDCMTFLMKMQGMEITAYTYVQTTPSRLITLGNGFTLGGVPMQTMIMNDSTYYFPLTYGSKYTNSKKSGSEQAYTETSTSEECDGFGKINTPFGTFDVLRIIKTTENKVYADGTIVNSNSIKRVSFTSTAVSVMIDTEQNSAISGIVNVKVAAIELYDAPATGVERNNTVINNFNLGQNYPNPFNPSTIISYDVPNLTKVELKVYDMLGREIALLINREQKAGHYDVKFDATGLSSGVYLYQLKAGEFVKTQKMILSK